MDFKVGNQVFNFHPDVIEGILEAEALTKADGVEHGFLFCDTPEGIKRGKRCTGNECSVQLTDCTGLGPVVGSFHSHPTVISFSLGDYVIGANEGAKHPENKYLLCVSLLDKGIRCKALKEKPDKAVMQQLKGKPDEEKYRSWIKPYYTKKISVSNEALNMLLAGTPWEDLPASPEVQAIDEMEGHTEGQPPAGEVPVFASKSPPGKYPWPEEPTGQYPWKKKQGYKSVKTPDGGIAMEPIPQPKILSPETEFIDIKSIETPDPDLIAMGEVLGYVGALSPIQLTKNKDAQGKWVIHDGRHRLVAWKVAGFKRVPVVFVEV